jgi:hypothetical protein
LDVSWSTNTRRRSIWYWLTSRPMNAAATVATASTLMSAM